LIGHCGLHAHAVMLCQQTDHVTRCMFLHVSFYVLPVYKLALTVLSAAVCPQLNYIIIIGRCESVSSALPLLSDPLSPSFSNAMSPAHPWSLRLASGCRRPLVVSNEAHWRTRYHWMSALVLLLVRKPNRTEPKPQFFPQNRTETDRPRP